jgi:hypothetical protein
MLTSSILAVSKLTDLKLSKPLIAQQGLYFRASAQAQPYRPQVWLIKQFEGEEGTTLSLFGNERHHPFDPFRLSWKLEGVAILKLLQLLIRSYERSNNLTSCSQVFSRKQAG